MAYRRLSVVSASIASVFLGALAGAEHARADDGAILLTPTDLSIRAPAGLPALEDPALAVWLEHTGLAEATWDDVGAPPDTVALLRATWAESLAEVFGSAACSELGEPRLVTRGRPAAAGAVALYSVAAWWDVRVAVTAPDCGTLEGTGRLVSMGPALALIVRFGAPVPRSVSPFTLADAALDWPSCWPGLGNAAQDRADGGIRWRQTPRNAPPAHAVRVLGLRRFLEPWPLHVTSWVRGDLWLLALRQGPTMRGCGVLPPPTLESEPSRCFETIAAPEGCLGGAIVGSPDLSASPFAIPHCPDAAKGETVLSVARRIAGEAGRVERLAVLPDETWRLAKPGPISPIMARMMGVPEGMACPTVTLDNDPTLGRCTAGLLDIACPRPTLESGRLGALEAGVGQGGLLQWVLGDGYAAITVLPRRCARDVYTNEWLFEHWNDISAPGFAGLEMRAALAPDFGTVLSYLPYNLAPSGAEFTYGIRFDPESKIGWPERVRVGDTVYGRTRLYVSPVLTHIVIDLK